LANNELTILLTYSPFLLCDPCSCVVPIRTLWTFIVSLSVAYCHCFGHNPYLISEHTLTKFTTFNSLKTMFQHSQLVLSM